MFRLSGIKQNIIQNQPLNPQDLNLLAESCNFNILEYLPRNFTITTRNSSAQFSTVILENSSSIILDFLKDNPTELQYHLNIDDNENTLGILSKIFQGECVKITKSMSSNLSRLRNELRLFDFPIPFMPNYGGLITTANLKTSRIQFISSKSSIKVEKSSLKKVIFSKVHQTFSIKTHKKEYKCNKFGILSSSIIREFLSENENADHYEYDFDDENEEFRFICDIFNFKTVQLTVHNVDVIKEIAEDLGIDCVIPIVDEFINDNEKVSRIIDDQQSLIDSIDHLFDLLYHIEEKTVNTVSMMIKDSKWSKTEEGIYELAAFIFQVIKTDIKLHEYLIELLKKLNEKEENDDDNKLDLLLPFVIKKSIEIFSKKLKNMNCSLIFPFVYRLYKLNIIPRDKIDEKLINCSLENTFFVAWFLPELIERNTNRMKIDIIKKAAFFEHSRKIRTLSEVEISLKKTTRQDKFGLNSIANDSSFSYIYHISKDIEEYKQMRDKGECNNEIMKALRNDDVDTFQSIISKNVETLLKDKIKSNMFEPFIKNKISYLNYAAAYGSLKCFKYMKLNYEKIDESTFEMAIIGGNNELIRIVDNEKIESSEKNPQQQLQQLQQQQQQMKNEFQNNRSKNDIQNLTIKALSQAIKRHKNDLFDWIIEQKFDKINQKELLLSLMICSIRNGNAHTLVQLIDNGFNFENYSESSANNTLLAKQIGHINYLKKQLKDQSHKRQAYAAINGIDPFTGNFSDKYSQFLEVASEQGFYSLLLFIINLINKDKEQKISVQPECTVIFGNIFIFKLFEKTMSETDLQTALIAAINRSSMNIIKYSFDTIVNYKIQLNSINSNDMLISAFNSDSNEILEYLIDQINKLHPINVHMFSKLLRNTNKIKKIQFYKKISELIYLNNPENDFTQVAIDAARLNMKKLIQFYIDQKYKINFIDLSESFFDSSPATSTSSNSSTVNIKIFSLVLNQLNPSDKKRMIDFIDRSTLKKDKPLIEFLLKENGSLENALIQAVKDNNKYLTELILKTDNSPSFINKNSLSGTALIIAVSNSNIEIIKLLLATPGIDPNVYYEKFRTPLIIAAVNSKENIFNLILDFYGDKIKDQKWQLEKAIKIIISIHDTNYEREKSRGSLGSNIKNKKNFSFGQREKVRILLKILKLNCIDPNLRVSNETFLTFAIRNDIIEIIKALLKYDELDINLNIPNSGDTALTTAIKYGNDEIIRLLIEHPKIDLNISNYDKETALSLALKLNLNKIAALILNNEKFIPEKNNIARAFCISNSLHFKNDLSVSKKLASFKCFDVNYILPISDTEYDSGVSYVNTRNKYIRSPLLKSVILDDVELLDLIIKNPSFNKTKKTIIEALKIAIQYNKINSMKKLFENSEELNFDINSQIFNNDKNSALIEAVSNCVSNNFIKSILEFPNFDGEKSDIRKAFELAFDHKSNNYFFFGEHKTMDTIYEYDAAHDNLIDLNKEVDGTSILTLIFNRLFAERDINLNRNNDRLIGYRPLPLENAIKNGHYIVSLCLINSNEIDFDAKLPVFYTDLYSSIDFGMHTTYLHLAAYYGRSKIMKEILTRKLINTNVTNPLGNTALIDACTHSNTECIKVLFEMDDLDYLHKNKRGIDALQATKNMIRYQYRNKEILEKFSIVDTNNKDEYLAKLLDLVSHIKQKNKKITFLIPIGKGITPMSYRALYYETDDYRVTSRFSIYTFGIVKNDRDYMFKRKSDKMLMKYTGFRFAPPSKSDEKSKLKFIGHHFTTDDLRNNRKANNDNDNDNSNDSEESKPEQDPSSPKSEPSTRVANESMETTKNEDKFMLKLKSSTSATTTTTTKTTTTNNNNNNEKDKHFALKKNQIIGGADKPRINLSVPSKILGNNPNNKKKFAFSFKLTNDSKDKKSSLKSVIAAPSKILGNNPNNKEDKKESDQPIPHKEAGEFQQKNSAGKPAEDSNLPINEKRFSFSFKQASEPTDKKIDRPLENESNGEKNPSTDGKEESSEDKQNGSSKSNHSFDKKVASNESKETNSPADDEEASSEHKQNESKSDRPQKFNLKFDKKMLLNDLGKPESSKFTFPRDPKAHPKEVAEQKETAEKSDQEIAGNDGESSNQQTKKELQVKPSYSFGQAKSHANDELVSISVQSTPKFKYEKHHESFSEEPDRDLQLLLKDAKEKLHSNSTKKEEAEDRQKNDDSMKSVSNKTEDRQKNEDSMKSVSNKTEDRQKNDDSMKSATNEAGKKKLDSKIVERKERKPRRFYDLMFDDDDDDEGILNSGYQQQQQLVDQNQLLLLQQQQQQWFQLIQMNNEFQARINYQMMCQAQMNQNDHQHSKKKKRKSKK